MTTDPYQSPSDGAANRWFRPWRVLSVVAFFVAVVGGVVGWQARPKDEETCSIE